MKSALVLLLFAPLAYAAAELPISISTVGNELTFDKKTIQVKPGQQVALTFRNAADPGSGMTHTWVLTRPGAEDKVATEAVEAGAAKDYVPNDPNVLAHTRLLQPGQSATIHFKAPTQPGNYPYICTYPAHSRILRGILQVG